MATLSPFINWRIQARAHQCAYTKIPFSEGQRVYSILARTSPKEPWQRHDYSEEGRAQIPSNMEILCQWQSLYKKPPAQPTEPLVHEDPEALLRELLAQGNPEKFPHCTILALMLERKRKLKMISRKQDQDLTWLVYEHPASGQTWLVPEVTPQASQMAMLQAEITAWLAPQ